MLPPKGYEWPGPPIRTKPLDQDPDQPHPYRDDLYDCLVCGGTRGNPIHMEPLEGWPK